MATGKDYSLVRHPLRDVLTDEEWQQLRDDVQYCRTSWPVSFELAQESTENPEK